MKEATALASLGSTVQALFPAELHLEPLWLFGEAADGALDGFGELGGMRRRQHDHGVPKFSRRAAASPTAVCGSITTPVSA